ncbi:uncharacterized protein LOC110853331 [Folsomia candida]|nr:uncharacterized protein LOC110853331 [Folsomia candida]
MSTLGYLLGDNLRARSVSRALSPYVAISELDDANQVVSRKHYSYRSSTAPPSSSLSLYDPLITVPRRYYGDWSTMPSTYYDYPRYRSSYYYDDILPYSRYRSDFGMSLTVRTPPPVTNYLQPIYKTYRHISRPQYHYYAPPSPPVVRNETYSPVYHYHIEPPRTRTVTTTRYYRTLPTYNYTPIYDNSYYYSRLLY